MMNLFRKHDPREIVTLRVLLPIDKMIAWLDFERIRGDRSSAMGRGPQADHLRGKLDHAVILVVGLVMQRDSNRHQVSRTRILESIRKSLTVPSDPEVGCGAKANTNIDRG